MTEKQKRARLKGIQNSLIKKYPGVRGAFFRDIWFLHSYRDLRIKPSIYVPLEVPETGVTEKLLVALLPSALKLIIDDLQGIHDELTKTVDET